MMSPLARSNVSKYTEEDLIKVIKTLMDFIGTPEYLTALEEAYPTERVLTEGLLKRIEEMIKE